MNYKRNVLEFVGPPTDTAGEPAARGGVRRLEQHARGGARARGALCHADGAVVRRSHAGGRARAAAGPASFAHQDAQVLVFTWLDNDLGNSGSVSHRASGSPWANAVTHQDV